MTPDVSILIVTYRCRDAARACLASLAETGGPAYEIVVLDNASGDGTVEMVREEFPGVRLIAAEENLGFALGCNRAAEEARGEYLLLLDVVTPEHGSLVASGVEPTIIRVSVAAKPAETGTSPLDGAE